MITRWPAGTVTFLFTDVEGSTSLFERFGHALVRPALARHFEIVKEKILENNGRVYFDIGDATQSAFALASDAVAAAIAIQRALFNEPWRDIDPIRIRIGIHTGDAVPNRGTYSGFPALYRCHRIMSVAHGRQILLSHASATLVRNDLRDPVALRHLGPHRLRDLESPEDLYQVLAPDLQDNFPPLRSLEQHAHNLPIQLTRLEDRVDDIKAVCDMLEDESKRLVTLMGPGGVGKTRVALQAAADLIHKFKDGVFLIELGSISDPNLVWPKVASTLGIVGEGDGLLENHLAAFLRDKQMLLIIDNIEHLRSESAKIGRLLATCAQLKVLVTSRFRLVLKGEWTHEVHPLDLPDASSEHSYTNVARSSSVRLFVQGAKAVQSDFKLTKNNALEVAAICRKLDGLPLAIELVVSQLRNNDVGNLLERLETSGRPLDLVDQGPIGVEKRQQTMRNAIAWSYNLLTPAEQALFRQLSVFAGSFSLDAAGSICDLNESDSNVSTEDLLYSLVDNKLLRIDNHGHAKLRFKQLETIRAYGKECLKAAGERGGVERRNALYFLRSVEHSDPRYTGVDEERYVEYVAEEYDNIMSVLQWAQSRKEFEIGLRLASALGWYWQKSGNALTGLDTIEKLLSLDAAHYVSQEVRAKAYDSAGTLAWSEGSYARAKVLLDQSLDLYQRADHIVGIASVCLHLGNVERDRSNIDEASSLYQKSLGYWEQLSRPWGIALIKNNMGTLACAQGRLGEAEECFTQSFKLLSEMGHKRGAAAALTNLALVATNRGKFFDAQALCHQSLQLSQDIGDMLGMANTLDTLGKLAQETQTFEAATSYFTQALELRKLLKEKRRLPFTLLHLGELAKTQGHYDKAESYFEDALQMFRDGQAKAGIASSLLHLGELAHEQGFFEGAVDQVSQALVIFAKLDLKWEIEDCLEIMARLAFEKGDAGSAATLAAAATSLRDAVGMEVTPTEQAELEKDFQILKQALGDDSFARYWDAGYSLTLEEATVKALDLGR